MRQLTHTQIKRCLEIILAILIVLLVALCVLLVREYRYVRQLEYATTHESLSTILHARGPIGASDAHFIESWMTFDYINHLFNLPPAYLQTTLAIPTNSHYPHLTLGDYAEDEHVAPSLFLTQVQNAVSAYFPQHQ